MNEGKTFIFDIYKLLIIVQVSFVVNNNNYVQVYVQCDIQGAWTYGVTILHREFVSICSSSLIKR